MSETVGTALAGALDTPPAEAQVASDPYAAARNLDTSSDARRSLADDIEDRQKHWHFVKGVEQQLKDEKAKLEGMDKRIIEAILESELTAIKLKGGWTASVAEQDHYSCPMDKQADLVEWLEQIGAGDLAKRAVSAQTLGAFCRNLESGTLELPESVDPEAVELPDFITKFTKHRLQVRKGG